MSEAFDGDGEPPSKRRRVSYSSLSESDLSSDDDEEKPLAASRTEPKEKAKKVPAKHGGKGKKGGKTRAKPPARGGKGMSSMKSKAQTAPASIPPPTDAEREDMERPATNGTSRPDAAVKVEDKMDEGQLSRLVTGVTVDAGGAQSATVSPRLRPSTRSTHADAVHSNRD